MSPQDFIATSQAAFRALGQSLFAALQTGEQSLLQLDAEQTHFLRFNAGRVRQNTDVEQRVLRLQYQRDGRSVDRILTLTGLVERDTEALLYELKEARGEAEQLPADPFQVPLANNGQSAQDFTGEIPASGDLIASLLKPASGLDLAGLFCGGVVISANQNSLGQNHWFSTLNFFVDYSLYDGQRAAKGLYADRVWSNEAWRTSLFATREQLELLRLPLQSVSPGRYRTYLAPDAVAELMGIVSWNGLSYSALRQGRGPLRRLAENETKLSPHLSLRENFALGLLPAFNSLGEVSATEVPLIENGELRSLLISSRSAQEYGVASNRAGEHESPRTPEIAPGHLRRDDILRELGTGLFLSNLHYLNWSDLVSARVTGMTRYACFWVENGKIVGPIKDLRFDVSLYDIWGANLRAVTDFQSVHPATSTYEARALGGMKTPGLMIDDFAFTL